MIAAIISALIFLSYLVIVVRYCRGVPPSLSMTYYILGLSRDPQDQSFRRLRASVFTFVLWAMALLLIAPMMDATPERWQFLSFLCLASICFVGAAPEFLEQSVSRFHIASALVAAAAGVSWAVVAGGRAGVVGLFSSAVICLALSLASRTLKESRVWWLELVAFGTVYITMFWMILL